MLLAEAELDNSLGSGGPGEVGPGWPGGRAQGGPGRWAQGGLGLRVVQPGFSKQHATCKMQVDRKLALGLFSSSQSPYPSAPAAFPSFSLPPWLKPSSPPFVGPFASFFLRAHAPCIDIFPEKVLLRSAHESGNARRADLASPRWGSAACMHRLASPRWGLLHARSRVHETEYHARGLAPEEEREQKNAQVAPLCPAPYAEGGGHRIEQTDIYFFGGGVGGYPWSS